MPVLELPINGISTTYILPASAFPAPRHVLEIHPYWSVVAFEGRAFPCLPLVFISRLLRLPISVRGKDTTLCKFLKLEAESCVDTSDHAVRGTRRRGRAAAARRARASWPVLAARASLPPASCGVVSVSSSLPKVALCSQRAMELPSAKSQGG